MQPPNDFIIERENECLTLMKNGAPRVQRIAESILCQMRAKQFITRRQVRFVRRAFTLTSIFLSAEELALLDELETAAKAEEISHQ